MTARARRDASATGSATGTDPDPGRGAAAPADPCEAGPSDVAAAANGPAGTRPDAGADSSSDPWADPWPDPWNAAVLDGAPLSIGHYPGALLMRLASAIHQESTSVYARRHGLTLPEWRILGRLYECAPVQLSVLCRVYCIDKGQAVRVLGTLGKRGLVRVSVDPGHRQRRVIDITPEGRALAGRVVPDAVSEQMRLLEALTAEERHALYASIHKLLALYGREPPGSVPKAAGDGPSEGDGSPEGNGPPEGNGA
jgi:DNA-binding MarR family transcriptional regulator